MPQPRSTPLIWIERPLPDIGPQEVKLTATFLLNGPNDTVQCNVLLEDPATGRVLGATVPVARSSIFDLEDLMHTLTACIVEVTDALPPF